MKTKPLMLLSIILGLSCTKENNNIDNKASIIGKWNLYSTKDIETRNYEKCNNDYIEFKDGNSFIKVSSNGTTCSERNESNSTYALENNKLQIGNAYYNYEIKDGLLTITEKDTMQTNEQFTYIKIYKSENNSSAIIGKWYLKTLIREEFRISNTDCGKNYYDFKENLSMTEVSFDKNNNCLRNSTENKYSINDNLIKITFLNESSPNEFDLIYEIQNNTLTLTNQTKRGKWSERENMVLKRE